MREILPAPAQLFCLALPDCCLTKYVLLLADPCTFKSVEQRVREERAGEARVQCEGEIAWASAVAGDLVVLVDVEKEETTEAGKEKVNDKPMLD